MSENIAIDQVRAYRSPDHSEAVIVEVETASGPKSYLLTLERAHDLLGALKQVVPGLHPMYRLPENKTVLSQGDLISSKRLTESGALTGHQDYFASRTDFRLFCVMTQTCDLQRPRCKEYITLSVVRAMKHVFDQESVENSKARSRTSTVIERIIEHQQNGRDYFYLHPEPKYEIEEDSVIDLRVMFSLSSEMHYDQIVQSRTVSMNELYAANLGWMAVFARIAMPPWEKLHPKETKEARIKNLIDIIQEKCGKIPDIPLH